MTTPEDRQFGPKGVEDMITLDNLTEETMLKNLQHRYNKNLIYTFTGSILISMNPYKFLPIYEQDAVQRYIGKRLGLESPHIFATADDCYRLMRDANRNQSVIISGESGAGKTEATKLILQYLAAMTNKRSEIEQMILQSSPILEAFGNAKTVRNNNSSRFGKLIEIGFDAQGYIAGARITQYLLERSRLVQQALTERNYHIFYQFLAGATDQERQQYRLKDAKDFRYMNQSGCVEIEGQDDEALFTKTRNAMNYLGISESNQDQIFSVLAAILHIGNITFAADKEGSKVTNEEALKHSAALVGTEPAVLGKALTTRSINVRGTVTTILLTPKQADDTRDAFAKALYARLFDWLCVRLNKAINRPNMKSTIAVLDIFGFENFKKNSFEQLCINYTNEKLQLHFNEHIFKIEQEEYSREKISWSKVDFKDNLECIQLIELAVKPPGLLALLDEETKFPKATDATFLDKIAQQHAKHSYFEKPPKLRTAFVVKHYAGDVAYEVEGFLDKNRDTLQSDLLAAVNASKSQVVREMFASMASSDADAKKISTVGGNFRNQLIQLITTLSATQTHYVRCIKPNTLQKPDFFDADMVLAQLRYAGMLETVRIRKCGYPIRYTLKDFHRRYGILGTGIPRSGDDKKICEMIFSQLKLEQGTYQVGITKVFLRDFQAAALEDKRNERIKKQIVAIQSWWRMIRARLHYLQMKGAAVVVQKTFRRHFYRRKFRLYRGATLSTQNVARMLLVYKRTAQKLSSKREEIRRKVEEARKKAKEDEERKRREAEREAERERKRQADEEARQKANVAKGLPPMGGPPTMAAPLPPTMMEEDAAPRGGPAGIQSGAVSSAAAAAAAPDRKANKDKWKPYRAVSGLQEAPPIVTMDNIAAYLFTEYADLYFRKPSQMPKKTTGTLTLKNLTNTLKRKAGTGTGLSIQEMVTYQRKPLEVSLLPLDERFGKAAVDCFNLILNYQHPPEKKPPDPLATFVLPLLRFGCAGEALRDELYCQMIKQIYTSHLPAKSQPPKEILVRGWELLAFASGTFLPTEKLRPYVAAIFLGAQNHDHKPISQLATYCLRRLERAALRASLRGLYRMHVPAMPEINSTLARKPLIFSVYLADEVTKYDLELDAAASANEAVAVLSHKLGLQDPSYFALFETYTQDSPAGKVHLERSLFVEEVVADPVSKASFISNFQFKLVFKRKLYINPRNIPDDPVERNLLYVQANYEVSTGSLPCTESDAVKLTALKFQHELGDFSSPGSYSNMALENAIPKPLLKKRGLNEWKSLIAVEHEMLKGVPKDEGKKNYLQFVTQLLFYGSTVFQVENKSQKELPAKFELMMNIEGVHFAVPEGENRNIQYTLFFSDFAVQYSAESVTLVVDDHGQTRSIEFQTRNGPEIFNLYSDYYFWLQAQSEWARAKEDYVVNDSDLLSFKRGELIHVLDKEDAEWFKGESLDKKRVGSFPSKSVQVLLREPAEVRSRNEAERKKLRVPRAERMDSRDYTAEGAKKRISSIIRPGDMKGKGGVRLSTIGGRDSYNPRLSSSKLVTAGKGKGAAPGGAAGPRWQKIAVKPDQYKLDAFAAKMCKDPKSLVFTKETIKDSLLKETDPMQQKLVIELCRTVMKYMDDLPRGKATDNELLLWIVNQLIPNPALVDEVFLATLKQSIANPKFDPMIKGWALLTVMCSLFMPSNELFPYVVAAAIAQVESATAKPQVATFAKDCLERLTRHKENPSVKRNFAPSRTELDSIIGAGLFGCQVYFEDKSSRQIDIDSITTASEVIETMVDLRRLRGWALFEVVSAENLYTEHIIKPDDCICDVMSKWERFVVPKGVTGDVDFQFVYKKYVFIRVELQKDLSHPAASKLMFYQTVNSVLRGRLPIAEEEAVYLAAVQLQYELGDYNDKMAIEDELGKYMPKHFVKEGLKKNAETMKVDRTATIKPQAYGALAQKVKLTWAGLQGKKGAELVQLYIQKVQDSPLYGAMLFPVQYIITRKNIKPALLAINEEGITVWDPITKQSMKKITFKEIGSYGAKKGSLSVVTGSLINPVVETFNAEESLEIGDVLKSYQTARTGVVLAMKKETLN